MTDEQLRRLLHELVDGLANECKEVALYAAIGYIICECGDVAAGALEEYCAESRRRRENAEESWNPRPGLYPMN